MWDACAYVAFVLVWGFSDWLRWAVLETDFLLVLSLQEQSSAGLLCLQFSGHHVSSCFGK